MSFNCYVRDDYGNCHDCVEEKEALAKEEGFKLGCIIGAAIIAWADAIREQQATISAKPTPDASAPYQ